MPEFMRPNMTMITRSGIFPCSFCGKAIPEKGFVCICTDSTYYCSLCCLIPHKSTCITWATSIKPRPSASHKLAFYFPQDSKNTISCWVPCPPMIKPPCVPRCEACIVCEGCHECRAHDLPFPNPILAQATGLPAGRIADMLSNWYTEPGVTDREHWTVATIFGLSTENAPNLFKKNLSIERFTGLSRDWKGPFVMIANEWSDCEGNAKARDITMQDLETVREYFLVVSPKELDDEMKAEEDLLAKGVLEMHDMLDAVLKTK